MENQRLSSAHYEFTFSQPASARLDKFLVEQLPEHSRARLQALIREGQVLVDGEPVTKTGQAVQSGQVVILNIPPVEPSFIQPEDIPIEIVFENADLIVVNKAAGMVVHPGPGHATGTLAHAVLGHAPDIEGIGGVLRPGVVHRLDKDTSGLILVAKNDQALRWLQDQFRIRAVGKAYLALIDGAPPTPKGRVEAPIGRDSTHRQRMAITTPKRGRRAVTEYFTAKSFENHTLLEAHPLTGRTHQIRLHCSFLKCPIVGDKIYGYRKLSLPVERHMLHAARLQITLPGAETPQEFEAPLPDDFQQTLDSLK
jgi:23S rRNA pseudouridine1911/1915/1917 synthase